MGALDPFLREREDVAGRFRGALGLRDDALSHAAGADVGPRRRPDIGRDGDLGARGRGDVPAAAPSVLGPGGAALVAAARYRGNCEYRVGLRNRRGHSASSHAAVPIAVPAMSNFSFWCENSKSENEMSLNIS